jgi:hypothetical protein
MIRPIIWIPSIVILFMMGSNLVAWIILGFESISWALIFFRLVVANKFF